MQGGPAQRQPIVVASRGRYASSVLRRVWTGGAWQLHFGLRNMTVPKCTQHFLDQECAVEAPVQADVGQPRLPLVERCPLRTGLPPQKTSAQRADHAGAASTPCSAFHRKGRKHGLQCRRRKASVSCVFEGRDCDLSVASHVMAFGFGI